jgi:hypothetical protein
MKRIYITDEAYNALMGYCLLKNKTWRGMSFEASNLILEAIAQKTNIPVDQLTSGPRGQKTNRPKDQRAISLKDQQTNEPVDQKPSEPIDQKTEAPSRERQAKKSIYDRWLVRFAGILDVQNMSKMEKEAKEAKFLFYPIGKDKAVAIDRYWINRAIELANNSQFKVGLGEAEEITRAIIEQGKRDEELTLKERVALTLYMLNRDGYAIFSSKGWTLAIPDIALEPPGKEKTTPQTQKPEAQKTEGEKKPEVSKTEEKKPEAKPESQKEESEQEDLCGKIPTPQDIEFVRVDGVVQQVTLRECAEKKGLYFYMLLPELGIVVNPKFEEGVLEKIRSGQVKYARADIDNAAENYAKNRAKQLNAEEKEKILMKALLMETKIIHTGGEWKVVDKPKTGKTESKPTVKTGSMIDAIRGQGV